jgi:hypothetical protein
MKSLFSPKVRARIVVRTVFSPIALLSFQSLVRERNVLGVMEYVPNSHVQIDVEAPKALIDALLQDMIAAPFIPTYARPFQISWMPFEGRYQTFRVSM